ncbi:MAG: methylenetetrahydrofolate--tRNA-(uracil(54)-C(5))-methyltransferase (FADH(2)-oxidizing) TrmFO [Coriobacteriia bacterium]|nr:methylenetetrahydrofolate--tRNA-(uracil(54)-C(5))-methyltransferase (FADH(2)-oxidizing) TrmFO [Coriobacteriia bacterium]
MGEVLIIGAGLAGSEAALQLARRGISVTLQEMRPEKLTPAHRTGLCAELVCSNSLKSQEAGTATGTLKAELDLLGSCLLPLARIHAVAAGSALAVDRDAFAAAVTAAVEAEPLITCQQGEACELDPARLTLIATGPLTSEALSGALRRLVGSDTLAFYDAAAPILSADSLDASRLFAASRRGKGGADYLNIALDKAEYERFYEALIGAQRTILRDFDRRRDLFAACQPIEEVARSGPDALRFGALKPVGIDDPRTGRWPYALVQLRAENSDRSAYNLVGFQTNLTFPEQRRVFSMLPGLEHAEFYRYGVMHRNTFLDAPQVLAPDLSLRAAPQLHVAGQLMGTEGYLEAIGGGLLAALMITARLRGDSPPELPTPATTLGALMRYATDPATTDYQPMHVNYGIIEALTPRVRNKQERYRVYHERALQAMAQWRDVRPELF